MVITTSTVQYKLLEEKKRLNFLRCILTVIKVIVKLSKLPKQNNLLSQFTRILCMQPTSPCWHDRSGKDVVRTTWQVMQIRLRDIFRSKLGLVHGHWWIREVLRTHPPPRPISFIFMQISKKVAK